MKRTAIVFSIIAISTTTAIAQDVPEALKKNNSSDTEKQETEIKVEGKPVEERPADNEDASTGEKEIKVEGKPVEEQPIEQPKTVNEQDTPTPVIDDKDNDFERPELDEGTSSKQQTLTTLRYKLRENGVKTCYAPLSETIKQFVNARSVESLELRSNIIKSSKSEPIILMDYAFVSNQNVEHSSQNLSLQATPFPEQNTCLINQTTDVVLNNVDSCSEMGVVENENFNSEGQFPNQFGKEKRFERIQNQLFTFNDIKEGGCHVRTTIFSQFTNAPSEENSEE